MQKAANAGQLWVAAVGLFVTIGLAFLGAYGSAKTEASELKQKIEEHRRTLEDHEPRLRAMEKAIYEIQADVKIVRQNTERGR